MAHLLGTLVRILDLEVQHCSHGVLGEDGQWFISNHVEVHIFMQVHTDLVGIDKFIDMISLLHPVPLLGLVYQISTAKQPSFIQCSFFYSNHHCPFVAAVRANWQDEWVTTDEGRYHQSSYEGPFLPLVPSNGALVDSEVVDAWIFAPLHVGVQREGESAIVEGSSAVLDGVPVLLLPSLVAIVNI